ncbi:uncharacterized protein METZ01_LOCUS305347, partial [marine metagenome]
MRSLAIFALATILSLLPVSANPQPQESPSRQSDDTLVLRFRIGPPTLNPITYRDVYAAYILQYTNAELYVVDKEYLRDLAAGKVKQREWPLKPELAADYPTISEDKLTWTIKLREGCKWHDGEEVTAHDIKASFEIMMNDKVDATRMRSYYEKIDEVIAEDDYTIKFKFKEKYYFAKYSLPSIPIAPLHIIEELDEPQDWNGI